MILKIGTSIKWRANRPIPGLKEMNNRELNLPSPEHRREITEGLIDVFKILKRMDKTNPWEYFKHNTKLSNRGPIFLTLLNG